EQVEPGQRVAFGFIAVAVPGLRCADRLDPRRAAAGFQPAAQAVGHGRFQIGAVGALTELVARVAGGQVIGIVVMLDTTLVIDVEPGLDALIEAVINPQEQALAALQVVVPVAADAIGGVVDRRRFVETGAETEAGCLIAAAQQRLALEGVIGTSRQAHFRVQPGFALAGEYLDHAAEGVSTVHRGAGAADHFHPFDIVDVQEVDAGNAIVGAGQPLAVDQHQGLVRVGAAQVVGRNTAAHAYLNTGYPGQQVLHAAGLQTLDVTAGEDSMGVGDAGALLGET